MAYVFDELLCITWLLAQCPGGEPGRGGALGAGTGQCARENRLGDTGDRHAEVQGRLHGPAAGALLFGGIDDDIDEGLAGLRVNLLEHLCGDLNQVALQLALVPFGKDVSDIRCTHAEAVAQQLVGLADQLHVRVLDAVVHHLHEMAGAIGADVGTAGHTVDVRGDLLQQRAEGFVRLLRAARHD